MPPTADYPGKAERRGLVLAALRAHGGPMASAEISARIGVPQRRLVESDGPLLLLEAEGVVGRTGRKRWTRWYAL